MAGAVVVGGVLQHIEAAAIFGRVLRPVVQDVLPALSRTAWSNSGPALIVAPAVPKPMNLMPRHCILIAAGHAVPMQTGFRVTTSPHDPTSAAVIAVPQKRIQPTPVAARLFCADRHWCECGRGLYVYIISILCRNLSPRLRLAANSGDSIASRTSVTLTYGAAASGPGSPRFMRSAKACFIASTMRCVPSVPAAGSRRS